MAIAMPSMARFIQNWESGWQHYLGVIWQTGLWVEAQVALPLAQTTYVPQLGMHHRSGNERKTEMNILDIFQHGKQKY